MSNENNNNQDTKLDLTIKGDDPKNPKIEIPPSRKVKLQKQPKDKENNNPQEEPKTQEEPKKDNYDKE
jgi:hypothetical protein